MNEIQNIPWGKVLSNFVWIFGASIILAVFSYHEFLSHQKKSQLKGILNERSFKAPFLWGVFLVTVGISLSVKNTWLAGVFGGGAFLMLVFLVRKVKTKKIKI